MKHLIIRGSLLTPPTIIGISGLKLIVLQLRNADLSADSPLTAMWG